jgi:hypothetical protein
MWAKVKIDCCGMQYRELMPLPPQLTAIDVFQSLPRASAEAGAQASRIVDSRSRRRMCL